jgi:hypothetical protein
VVTLCLSVYINTCSSFKDLYNGTASGDLGDLSDVQCHTELQVDVSVLWKLDIVQNDQGPFTLNGAVNSWWFDKSAQRGRERGRTPSERRHGSERKQRKRAGENKSELKQKNARHEKRWERKMLPM